MARNYLAELHNLGKTYASMARELNKHPTTISRWARGITSSPKPLYEPIRNISRRQIYRSMREAGFPTYQATAGRRVQPSAIEPDIKWLNMVVDQMYKEWNFRYNAYKMNPEGWIKAHPNSDIPRYTPREEVVRRIKKGEQSKTKEEIEYY